MEGLYEKEFSRAGIDLVIPDRIDQDKITGIIKKIVNNNTKTNDKEILVNIIGKLKNKGAEIVILGCTDLSSFISQSDCTIPMIDTLDILKIATVERLLRGKNEFN